MPSWHGSSLPEAGPVKAIAFYYRCSVVYKENSGSCLCQLSEIDTRYLRCACSTQCVGKTIRSLYPNMDKLLSNGKKVFLKSPTRSDLFKNKNPILHYDQHPLPLAGGLVFLQCYILPIILIVLNQLLTNLTKMILYQHRVDPSKSVKRLKCKKWVGTYFCWFELLNKF